jgi:drug/metabolite transporter (DMT)-like permease
MRSLIAVLLPVLAGALVYVVLAPDGSSDGSMPSSMLLLPALLIGVMLVALVFLPLWSVLVHKTRRIRIAFLCIGGAILVMICAGLTMFGAFRSGAIEGVAVLFVAGFVLVATFGVLMDPRRVRGGEKQH